MVRANSELQPPRRSSRLQARSDVSNTRGQNFRQRSEAGNRRRLNATTVPISQAAIALTNLITSSTASVGSASSDKRSPSSESVIPMLSVSLASQTSPRLAPIVATSSPSTATPSTSTTLVTEATMLGISEAEYDIAIRAEQEMWERIEQIRKDEEFARTHLNETEEEFEDLTYDGNPCAICLEDVPVAPARCIFCKKMIGCHRCVKQWYENAQKNNQARSCPLCRHEWARNSFEISSLAWPLDEQLLFHHRHNV